MIHTFDWVQNNCTPFVTYDDEFQIWKNKNNDEYWAYDVDEEAFVRVKLIAIERFHENQDEFELMTMYVNDWCGEVDGSYIWIDDPDDPNLEIATYEYAWFERI